MHPSKLAAMRSPLLAALVMCSLALASAALASPAAEWKPKHRDKTWDDLPKLPTRVWRGTMSKLGIRVSIRLPRIYVHGKPGRYNVVTPAPRDSCANRTFLCSYYWHAESGFLPTVHLRSTGSVWSRQPGWVCNADKTDCEHTFIRRQRIFSSMRYERVRKVGEDKVTCSVSAEVPTHRFRESGLGWMKSVCASVKIRKT